MANRGTLGVALALLGFVVQILALALPYWQYISQSVAGVDIVSHGGLWKNCVENPLNGEDICVGEYKININDPSWFDAVKAMEVLGFIAAFLCLLFVILTTFIQSLQDNTILRILAKVFALAAAVLIIIGVIIYGAEVKENLHAAFGLAIIAFLIFAAEFVILIVVK